MFDLSRGDPVTSCKAFAVSNHDYDQALRAIRLAGELKLLAGWNVRGRPLRALTLELKNRKVGDPKTLFATH